MVGALAAFAAFPALASAEDCNHDGSVNSPPDPALVDPGGFSWDFLAGEAAADDGYHNASTREDAFDTMGTLWVSTDSGTTFNEYANPDLNGCTSEADGRQIVYPNDTTTVTGLTMGRKVYVPSSGLAFARWLDTLTNTSGSPMTFLMRWGGNLGSDSHTTIAGTSSGDNLMSEADYWANTYEAPLSATSDPLVTTMWDGATNAAQRATHADRFDPSATGYAASATSDYIGTEYSVTLAAGETKRFMHVMAMRLSLEDQAAASTALAAEPDELGTGLSPEEQDSIQNWTFDRDHDGVKNRNDNCPGTANPGQENLDGDSLGDVCDDDIDGDGLSNALEASLRTDPRKADTDGDHKNDSADSCPTIAAATDTGCPAPVVLPPPADKTPPIASIALSKTISLGALLKKGLTVKVTTNEPASFTFEIVAQTKSAKLAKVGDLVISTKSLGRGTGTRTVKLTIAKKWRKALKAKSKLTLRTVATDSSGNRTTSSKALKLKK